ncbi:MAG TPA: hypothetical protein VIR27_20015, partial [Mycobacteriales bacterium]
MASTAAGSTVPEPAVAPTAATADPVIQPAEASGASRTAEASGAAEASRTAEASKADGAGTETPEP